MAKTRKISRREQYAALYHGTRIEQKRQKCFYGLAKKLTIEIFNGSCLLLSSQGGFSSILSTIYRRSYKKEHFARLSQVRPHQLMRSSVVTRLNGLLFHFPRGSNSNVFVANIGQKLQNSICPEVLYGGWLTFTPKVNEPAWWVPEVSWRCMNLSWCADLSDELRAYLTHQTSNELSLSAGEIYFHILRCDPADTRTIDSWWAQVQSADEVRELKRLLARKNLNAPFRALAKMPASGRGLLAGCIGGLLRLKCDKEVIRYLRYIYDSWSHLLDHSVEVMQKIDVHTVECLESRNPANSVSVWGVFEAVDCQGIDLRVIHGVRTGNVFGEISSRTCGNDAENSVKGRRFLPSSYG
jgi:hypothetical protein